MKTCVDVVTCRCRCGHVKIWVLSCEGVGVRAFEVVGVVM